MLAPFKDVTAYGPAELQRFRERFAALVQHYPRQWQQAQCALVAIRLLWIPAVLAFFLQAGLLAWVLWLAFAGLIAYAVRVFPRLQSLRCRVDRQRDVSRACSCLKGEPHEELL